MLDDWFIIYVDVFCLIWYTWIYPIYKIAVLPVLQVGKEA